MKKLLISWTLAIAGAASSWGAEQKVLDIKLKNGGGGEIRVFATDEPRPVIEKFTVRGRGLGQVIDQTFSGADVEAIRSSGRARPIVRVHGVNALTFMAGPDFTMERGGSIQVGYLTSPTSRQKVTVLMSFDEASNRWWLTYTPRGQSGVRIQALELDVRMAPIVGPIGIKSVVGVDEFGRKFPIQAERP